VELLFIFSCGVPAFEAGSLEMKVLPILIYSEANGAGDGTRTRDSLLGRQELYH
jgi:hypothetical protein